MAGTLIDFVMKDKEFMTELNKAREEAPTEKYRARVGSIHEIPGPPSLFRRLGTLLRIAR